MSSPRDSRGGLRELGRPVRLVLSSAPEDEAYREELVRHLQSLRRKGIIEVWHDGLIALGEDQAYERRRRIEEADVILLLVSADYLASDRAYVEMEAAVARRQLGKARVMALIVRHVDWTGTPVERFPLLPHDGKPISSSTWRSRDEAWVDVVQGIRNVIDYAVTRSDPGPPPQASALNGAWKPDARWLRGPGADPAPRYEIQL